MLLPLRRGFIFIFIYKYQSAEIWARLTRMEGSVFRRIEPPRGLEVGGGGGGRGWGLFPSDNT